MQPPDFWGSEQTSVLRFESEICYLQQRNILARAYICIRNISQKKAISYTIYNTVLQLFSHSSWWLLFNEFSTGGPLGYSSACYSKIPQRKSFTRFEICMCFIDWISRNDMAGSHIQFSCSVVSTSLWPHRLQHARRPCPSPTPRACSNSCTSSW